MGFVLLGIIAADGNGYSAPRTKNFIAASVAPTDSRLIATIAYCDNDSNSSPKYSVKKWLAEIITIMPRVANSARLKNSPLSMPRSVMYSREYTRTAETVRYTSIFSISAIASSTNIPENVYTTPGAEVAKVISRQPNRDN